VIVNVVSLKVEGVHPVNAQGDNFAVEDALQKASLNFDHQRQVVVYRNNKGEFYKAELNDIVESGETYFIIDIAQIPL